MSKDERVSGIGKPLSSNGESAKGKKELRFSVGRCEKPILDEEFNRNFDNDLKSVLDDKEKSSNSKDKKELNIDEEFRSHIMGLFYNKEEVAGFKVDGKWKGIGALIREGKLISKTDGEEKRVMGVDGKWSNGESPKEGFHVKGLSDTPNMKFDYADIEIRTYANMIDSNKKELLIDLVKGDPENYFPIIMDVVDADAENSLKRKITAVVFSLYQAQKVFKDTEKFDGKVSVMCVDASVCKWVSNHTEAELFYEPGMLYRCSKCDHRVVIHVKEKIDTVRCDTCVKRMQGWDLKAQRKKAR